MRYNSIIHHECRKHCAARKKSSRVSLGTIKLLTPAGTTSPLLLWTKSNTGTKPLSAISSSLKSRFKHSALYIPLSYHQKSNYTFLYWHNVPLKPTIAWLMMHWFIHCTPPRGARWKALVAEIKTAHNIVCTFLSARRKRRRALWMCARYFHNYYIATHYHRPNELTINKFKMTRSPTGISLCARYKSQSAHRRLINHPSVMEATDLSARAQHTHNIAAVCDAEF